MMILIAAAVLAAQAPAVPAAAAMAQPAQHATSDKDCCKDCRKDMDKAGSGHAVDRMQDHGEHGGR